MKMNFFAFSAILTVSICSIDSQVTFPVMDAVELIDYWRYPYENHFIASDDGYILNFQRIGRTLRESRPTIYLQHGLFGSSARFTAGPPHQSLAYILADLGYEVWVGNARGNTYSRSQCIKDLKIIVTFDKN